VRLAAVEVLGRMRARRSCRALLRLAEEDDQPLELRVAAIRAAGRTRRKQDAADVGQFLASREEPLRAAAIMAMGNLQGKRSVRALVKGALANTFKLHAHESAHLPAKALTKIGDRYALSIAQSGLGSSRPKKRACTAELLGHVIGPYAVEALIGACGDEHPGVRKAALRSLAKQTTYRLV